MIKELRDFMEESSSLLCNHPVRFSGHMYWGSGDKMFLIYHVASRDRVFKGLCDLLGWSVL